MSLTGGLFLSLVAGSAGAAFVLLVVRWPALGGTEIRKVAARAGLLLLVNVLVVLTVATQLNAAFLFFADWSDLAGAINGTVTKTALAKGATAKQAAAKHVRGSAATSTVLTQALPPGGTPIRGALAYIVTGANSGIRGTVLVELPPGYLAASSARTRYPVLETFQGYPGGPGTWIDTMNLGGVMAQQVAARRMRPALIVSPQVEIPSGVDTECVNGRPGYPQVETWLAEDVPNWVAHHFRVNTDRSSWASIGLSAGGWCAAMVTMLHPAQYAAGIVMGGYFRPAFGTGFEPYPPKDPLASRYDLVAVTARTPPPVAIWLETSHADPISYSSSAALLKVTRPPLSLDAIVLQHAGHRFSLWQALLPNSLTWLGANIPGFKALP